MIPPDCTNSSSIDPPAQSTLLHSHNVCSSDDHRSSSSRSLSFRQNTEAWWDLGYDLQSTDSKNTTCKNGQPAENGKNTVLFTNVIGTQTEATINSSHKTNLSSPQRKGWLSTLPRDPLSIRLPKNFQPVGTSYPRICFLATTISIAEEVGMERAAA